MLETDTAMAALKQLGLATVDARARFARPPIPFAGNVNNMDAYVRHFLQKTRADFPLVVVGETGNLDALAYTSKGDWNGGFNNYQPKAAGSILYNAQVRICSLAN